MEVRKKHTILPLGIRCILLLLLLFCTNNCQLFAQQSLMKYTIKDGKMHIELGKNISLTALDSFINKYHLADLGLYSLCFNNQLDSAKNAGWQIGKNNSLSIIITKPFSSFNNINKPADKIEFLSSNDLTLQALFPNQSSSITFGCNRLKNKQFAEVATDSVRFFLRNHLKASTVKLASSFTNWQHRALDMSKTDSGWICTVKLAEGKYWYKFIVDGNWINDDDNSLKENDNNGNVNSVYYKTNTIFKLNGFATAKKVYLAGSFNNWKEKDLPMQKSESGWQLPVYLANGTYTYRFIVDNKWMIDPDNSYKLPNEYDDFNSVLSKGNAYPFKLSGFENAKNVYLVGSFNKWRPYELPMKKIEGVWQIDYVLSDGNFEYRYIVDGKETVDTSNKILVKGKDGKTNNFLIVNPNYTFKVKGLDQASKIYLVGDFNNWLPNCLLMQRVNGEWICNLHLSPGKHLYKLIVDDKWMIDPTNPYWEQNEYGTGNSVFWMEQQ